MNSRSGKKNDGDRKKSSLRKPPEGSESLSDQPIIKKTLGFNDEPDVRYPSNLNSSISSDYTKQSLRQREYNNLNNDLAIMEDLQEVFLKMQGSITQTNPAASITIEGQWCEIKLDKNTGIIAIAFQEDLLPDLMDKLNWERSDKTWTIDKNKLQANIAKLSHLIFCLDEQIAELEAAKEEEQEWKQRQDTSNVIDRSLSRSLEIANTSNDNTLMSSETASLNNGSEANSLNSLLNTDPQYPVYDSEPLSLADLEELYKALMNPAPSRVKHASNAIQVISNANSSVSIFIPPEKKSLIKFLVANLNISFINGNIESNTSTVGKISNAQRERLIATMRGIIAPDKKQLSQKNETPSNDYGRSLFTERNDVVNSFTEGPLTVRASLRKISTHNRAQSLSDLDLFLNKERTTKINPSKLPFEAPSHILLTSKKWQEEDEPLKPHFAEKVSESRQRRRNQKNNARRERFFAKAKSIQEVGKDFKESDQKWLEITQRRGPGQSSNNLPNT